MTSPEPPLLIRNARLFDPASNIDVIGAIAVADGRIVGIGPDTVAEEHEGAIDAGGCCLFPAFCDPHVHFRTPGETEKEDLESGSRAALAGGFTSVIQMPNTNPVVDTPELVRDLTRDDPIELRVLAAVTYGSQSRELTDFASLLDAGAVGFTDDGQPVSVPVFMKAALEFGCERDVPITSHAEEPTIGLRGIVRAGTIADSMGVPGWNPRRESAMVERDAVLARRTGGHVHIAHVSTRGAVEIIRKAKSGGIRVTAEVTPHHLSLTVSDVPDIGADAKMNPPLGTEDDRRALIEGLADGTIDCIATDHAPHTPREKSQKLERAPFGVIGLETSFAVAYTRLVRPGAIGLARLVDAMSRIPREIYHLEPVALKIGSRADLVLVDLEKSWTVEPGKFQSRARNCPFKGMELYGKVLWTMYRGRILWEVRD